MYMYACTCSLIRTGHEYESKLRPNNKIHMRTEGNSPVEFRGSVCV